MAAASVGLWADRWAAFWATLSAPLSTQKNKPAARRATAPDSADSSRAAPHTRVTQAELNYVKQFFVRQFGVEAATDGIRMLRDVLKQQIPVYEVSRQIGQMLNYSSRLQLIDYLFGISNADGSVQANESNVIEVIARNMGISDTDFNSIKSMFVKQDADSAYKILGISPSATDDEVKKAYRKMAVENHPDKVAYLGEDVQRAAKEKFQKINEAYEAIKKQRGFS